MVAILPVLILAFSDIMVYGTYPVHIRFFWILLTKRNNELDDSFQILLMNLTMFNILFASSHIFILEPAAQGLFPDFYAATAQYLGRIELIKTTVLALGMVFSLFIGFNRLTAFAFPMKQTRIWTPFNTKVLCCIVWGLIITGSLPILIGPSTGYRTKINFLDVISVEYFFLGWYDSYPLASLMYTGAFEIIKKIQTQLGSYKTFSRNVYKMTIAAAINSLGGWFIFLFFLAYYVFQWTMGIRIVNFTYYSLVLRVLTSFNNMLTPWVMLATFRSIRTRFIGKRRNSEVSFVSQNSASIVN